MTTDRIIEKLRKLKAHAESAEAIGNEAEAQAFAEMFQRIMMEHKLEMTDIEFARVEVEDPVDKHYIDYSKYPDYKTKAVRIAWMESLASIIAKAHFCRILLTGGNRLALVGRKQDAQVAEWMIITMHRAAERIAARELQKYRWEVYKRDGSCAAARGFRESFLGAFVARLSQRYQDLHTQATTSQSNALVRIRKEEDALNKYFAEQKFSKSRGLQLSYGTNAEGRRRGIKAADEINIGQRPITAGATTRGVIA